MQLVNSYIPEEKEKEYLARKDKRVERYLEYKNMMMDEIVELK